jgi:hypothetical protein
MTFPDTPLDTTVELRLGGVWTDITSLVYNQDPITVTRGEPRETPEVEASTCGLTANDQSGNLSPRNPTGIYYGLIGRNTRMRVRVAPAPDAYVLLPTLLSALSTPDSAGLSITGDIDIRAELDLTALPPPALGYEIAGKDVSAGNQRSWLWYVTASGTLHFEWTTNGSTVISATSTAPITAGRIALRVTLDVNNGASGKTVTFYTAPTMAGPFVQLGSAVTTAGTTSIFDSTSPVKIGDSANFANFTAPAGSRVYAFQLYQGIAGTLRADVHFDDAEPGATSFADGQGNTWTLAGDASIVDPEIRFDGEVSVWPHTRSPSGLDVRAPLQASGILRRLTQGVSPLKSTLYRAYTTLATPPKAYWPCEDGQDATVLASALPGGLPMTVVGKPTLATSTEFKASEPLPVMNASQWTGLVPGHAATGEIQVWTLISIPAAGTTNGQSLYSLYATGTVKVWSVRYEAPGGLSLKGFDSDGTMVANSGVINFGLDGTPERLSLSLKQNGSNIDWELLGQRLDGIGGIGGTFNSLTLGRAARIVINPGADQLGDITFGHVSIHSEIRSVFDLLDEFRAYSGERAGRRAQRLCAEEGVSFRAVGDLDATEPMGAQLPKKLVDLLREAADADDGILFEPRDLFGLAFRTRESMYRQASALPLDFAAKHFADDPAPVDDDQQTRNDLTVQREGGASFRLVQATGPLSVLPPPDGVGRYDDQVTLSLASDLQLPDAAGWRLFLGTVDEARYPQLAVNLARPEFAQDPAGQALTQAARDLDLGDRLTIDNPPPQLPPDQISQLARGLVEVLEQRSWRIDINATPESPWAAPAVYDDGISRYSSDGSTLDAGISNSATSLSIATPSGPLWTHADGDFEIRVGGEVMLVTNITGAASPQTFTVTRSVNSVVKAHTAGAAVELAQPRVYVP